ncbi:MAG TPA: glycosyltransferase family 2 protein [Bacteroidales bacterium]|nr:glycosyltransferase family 2 protein [Bacteroidales bacterium]HPS61496.1 glycosyltransferase family 2 protein [Bacteroidales bacterium]
MEPEPRLTVIVPAFNEMENLERVLPPLISYCRERNWQIILVNDGSDDATREYLKKYDGEPVMKVIHHKLNKGYGAAIKSGIRACETEHLITYDADGQHFLEDIDKLRDCLLARDADMVVGSRKGLKSSSIARAMGKSIIRLIARIMMTVPVHDINSGMKIYRTDLAKKYLDLTTDTMSFSDVITLVFINNRHLVLEEPIRIRDRTQGESTIGIQTAFQTVMEILHIVILFNPMKIFLPLSVLCFIFTTLWGVPLLLEGRGLSIGSLLGLIMCILLFLLGLIAEQLSLIRRNQNTGNPY